MKNQKFMVLGLITPVSVFVLSIFQSIYQQTVYKIFVHNSSLYLNKYHWKKKSQE